jgi:hypothetical protein
MPITSQGVTVGTAATILVHPTANFKFVYVQAGNADAQVHVGGSDVSAANGILLSATNNTVFQLNGDDTLYAISDTAETPVKVLQVK